MVARLPNTGRTPRTSIRAIRGLESYPHDTGKITIFIQFYRLYIWNCHENYVLFIINLILLQCQRNLKNVLSEKYQKTRTKEISHCSSHQGKHWENLWLQLIFQLQAMCITMATHSGWESVPKVKLHHGTLKTRRKHWSIGTIWFWKGKLYYPSPAPETPTTDLLIMWGFLFSSSFLNLQGEYDITTILAKPYVLFNFISVLLRLF